MKIVIMITTSVFPRWECSVLENCATVSAQKKQSAVTVSLFIVVRKHVDWWVYHEEKLQNWWLLLFVYTIFIQFHIVLINFQELWPVDRRLVGPVYPIPDSFTTCWQVCQLDPFMCPTQHVIFPQYRIYSQYVGWLFSWYRFWR